MDCKHEKIYVNKYHDVICRTCAKVFEKSEYVILPKTRHDQMVQVISLASDLRMYYNEWVGMKFEGESGSIAYLEFIDKQNVPRESYYNIRDMLDKALKAYDEGGSDENTHQSVKRNCG